MPNTWIDNEDYNQILWIGNRAARMAKQFGRVTTKDEIVTCLQLCHLNGCQLRLVDLKLADDADFAHDVFGILGHVSRETGELDGLFWPRFAQLPEGQI